MFGIIKKGLQNVHTGDTALWHQVVSYCVLELIRECDSLSDWPRPFLSEYDMTTSHTIHIIVPLKTNTKALKQTQIKWICICTHIWYLEAGFH